RACRVVGYAVCLRRILFAVLVAALSQVDSLSLHDALPIFGDRIGGLLAIDGSGCRARRAGSGAGGPSSPRPRPRSRRHRPPPPRDRKSTRLNSSHLGISYAVFCLKKKKPKMVTPAVIITTA